MVPGADFDIQVVSEGCDLSDVTSFSTSLPLGTSRWGDLVSDCTTTKCGPPDGSVDVITNVVAGLEKFLGRLKSPTKACVDVEPERLDQLINRIDLSRLIDASNGSPYPFTVATPCP